MRGFRKEPYLIAAGFVLGGIIVSNCDQSRQASIEQVTPYAYDANEDGIDDLILAVNGRVEKVFIGQQDEFYVTVADYVEKKYGTLFGKGLEDSMKIKDRAEEFLKERGK